VIDLKHEMERELSLIDPPDLWDRIEADAANDRVAPALYLSTARRRRSTSRWLVAAAVVAAIALVGALTWPDDDQGVDTVPADTGETTTTVPEPPVWAGPVRDPGSAVHRMAGGDELASGLFGVPEYNWEDPLDASEPWADVEHVLFNEVNRGHWTFDLAASPPLLTDLEPGVRVAYGLVLDTNADGAADYLAGIDNDAPRRGDFRAWVTDLATGETEVRVEPPYPVEFGYPSEEDPDYPVNEGYRPRAPLFLTFLGDKPRDLDPKTVRFYLWTSASRDGQVFAQDYAPDTGWITAAPS